MWLPGSGPGQMGDQLPAVDLGSGARALAIAVGSNFVCSLISGGGLKCIGGNAHGQLGLGDTTTRERAAGNLGDALPFIELGNSGAALQIVSVAAGGSHACAIVAESHIAVGRLKCWGADSSGR